MTIILFVSLLICTLLICAFLGCVAAPKNNMLLGGLLGLVLGPIGVLVAAIMEGEDNG